jgi:hypothetical protein
MGYRVEGYLVSDTVQNTAGQKIHSGSKVNVDTDPKTGEVSISSGMTGITLGYAENSYVEYASMRQKFGVGAGVAGMVVGGPVVGLLAGKVFDKNVPQYFLTVVDGQGYDTVIMLPGNMGTSTFLRGLDQSKTPDEDAIDVHEIAWWIVSALFIMGTLMSLFG